ncbi:MAG: hypothetical protein MZW92_81215 [Comamonadaceae bacterium]|nr:hypothetical protein [Comamonadaceae bacterium]
MSRLGDGRSGRCTKIHANGLDRHGVALSYGHAEHREAKLKAMAILQLADEGTALPEGMNLPENFSVERIVVGSDRRG